MDGDEGPPSPIYCTCAVDSTGLDRRPKQLVLLKIGSRLALSCVNWWTLCVAFASRCLCASRQMAPSAQEAISRKKQFISSEHGRD